MPLLSLLSPADQRKFDAPPTFQRDERQAFLVVTPDVRRLVRGIHKPSNQIGLIPQLGYFRATARFFTVDRFRGRDVDFVRQQLSLPADVLADYTGTVVMRHRELILKHLGWSAWNSETRLLLQVQAAQLSQQQFRPSAQLQSLVDYCWKHRIERPSYHELASLITHSYNDTEAHLLQILQSTLTRSDRLLLDELLSLARRQPQRAFRTLTMLKHIDQSLKPAAIAENAETARRFLERYEAVQSTLDALSLSDRAAEYYATWLIKAEVKQLLQFANPHKKYLYLLAFVRHQCFLRQDTLADILLKTVNAALNTARSIVKERDQLTRADQQRAMLALSQSHKQASRVLNEITTIVQDTTENATNKYQQIERLIHDYQREQDQQKNALLAKLEQQLEQETQEKTWFDALRAVAGTLRRRLAPVLLALKFDETSSSPLLQTLLDFQAAEGGIGPESSTAFMTATEVTALEQTDNDRRPRPMGSAVADPHRKSPQGWSDQPGLFVSVSHHR